MRGWGRSREERQVQEAERDLYPGYLQVSLQPVKLSLYQVAAVMEEEIHLSGEGDDVCRTQIPAEGSNGRGQRWGLLCISHPSGKGGQSLSPSWLPVPQAFIVPWHAEASLVVREVAG